MDPNIFFGLVSVGVIVGVVLPLVSNFNERGHAAVLVVTQVLAILGVLASSGQVVVPAFFEAIFIGYFATLAAQAQVASKQACEETRMISAKMK